MDNNIYNQQDMYQQNNNSNGLKSKLVTVLLWWFLGVWGIHRFYVGKIGTGILWLLTGGVFGIGYFVDFFMLFRNTFTTKDDQPLNNDCPQWLMYLALALIILAFLGVFLTFAVMGLSIFAIIGSAM